MNDIFETINSYLHRKSIQKTANLASLFDSSDAAQQASRQRRYIELYGIPLPEEALGSPSVIGPLLADAIQRRNQTPSLPTYDPNNPFSQLALAERAFDLQTRAYEQRQRSMLNMLNMNMQLRMMQQALAADIATRRQQMFFNALQALTFPIMAQYRLMMESNRPYVIAGGARPQSPPSGSLPSYVSIQI